MVTTTVPTLSTDDLRPLRASALRRLLVQAVQNQDNVLAQALVMLVVAVFVITNLVVDVLYAWLDPRIRYS